MDTRTGRIFTDAEVAALSEKDKPFLKQIDATREQIRTMRVGRNDPCPCGSGRKFKACCLNQVGVSKPVEKLVRPF